MGIERGDEVLVPDITFIGSANAVLLAGATPVFVEVNRYNFQIDVARAADLVTPRTKAIMPVHLYGMIADMDSVMAFARQHRLQVIEDAAQTVGVRYKGRHAGTFGEAGCFSFFADKTITTGEGGYVVCRDETTFDRLRLLRNQGRLNRGSFVHPAIGYNLRLTDLQAAVGLMQMDKLDEIIRRKRAIFKHYRSRLESFGEISFLQIEEGSEYVPFRVVLLYRRAHELREYLTERGVASRTFFYPLHKQPCFQALGKQQGGPLDLEDATYPNAVHGYEYGICLPVFPQLTEQQVDYICDQIAAFCRER
jgi:perosamine synthetase